jgi:uncharacterized protein (DUF4415 family)
MSDDVPVCVSDGRPQTDWQPEHRSTNEDVRDVVVREQTMKPTDMAFWQDARVVMPRRKEVVTIRLDADLLAWLRRERGYQTRINAVLRAYMQAAKRS